MKPFALLAALVLSACASAPPAGPRPAVDVVVRGGTIYDGSGGAPFVGDLAIDDDRIVYVGPRTLGRGRIEIDAAGKAVSPGFINMLSWATESLIADGRGLSDLSQGVTLAVMGEGSSMGPLSPEMKRAEASRQGDIKYDISWTTLDQYLTHLETRGPRAERRQLHRGGDRAHARAGRGRRRPHPGAAGADAALVVAAMEDGAMGVGSSLIYAPGSFAETAELAALATEAGALRRHVHQPPALRERPAAGGRR
jgi:N-acyl-D-amino-acid deacylase